MIHRGLAWAALLALHAALGISERTARTHVSHVLCKLGVSSRTQAALIVNRADSS